MKNNLRLNLIIFLCLTFGSSAQATFLMIDNFSTAPYSIGSSLLSSNTSPITSPIADNRRVNGIGTQVWGSFVDIETETLNYSVSGSPGPDQRIGIAYSRDSGSLDFTGFSHFSISVQDLAGTADLYVLYRGLSNQTPSQAPIAIDASGDYPVPFPLMGEEDPFTPSLVDFRFFPRSDDFSMKLSSIGVIPEPTFTILIPLGAFAFCLRRRRKS